mmetsp:Transcript_26505/g.58880  ORF Transcript_26505/g.58880 Transcript_26505/m.58880 type:complete len:123 (-) Transcript_26505:589-957(-)
MTSFFILCVKVVSKFFESASERVVRIILKAAQCSSFSLDMALDDYHTPRLAIPAVYQNLASSADGTVNEVKRAIKVGQELTSRSLPVSNVRDVEILELIREDFANTRGDRDDVAYSGLLQCL